MSKIKIQGNSSGTGVLTLEAPNTATDRTITLPDATGTLLTADGDGSSLTGVGVDGISSSADATAITINASEDVGIGTTSPASSHAGGSTLQIGPNVSGEMPLIMQHIVTDHVGVMGNAHYDGTWKYKESEQAYSMRFHGQGAGTQGIVFSCAAAGTAGNTITNWDGTDIKMVITPDGRGLSQFTAFMWCRMNGSGTPAVTDGHNVSSITDNATGSFRMNFTVNASNANYSAVTGKDAIASNAGNAQGLTFNVAYLGIENYENNSKVDSNNVTGIVFGDS
jgi:hypothetical protein